VHCGLAFTRPVFSGRGRFGQVIQRSGDGGATWAPMGNEFRYHGVPGTHQWYDGTPYPWEFARGLASRAVAQ
jgi:hypothetical protein